MKINQVNLRQVKHDEGGFRLDPMAELFDAIAAHPADQTQDYPGTVHFCFNSEHEAPFTFNRTCHLCKLKAQLT